MNTPNEYYWQGEAVSLAEFKKLQADHITKIDSYMNFLSAGAGRWNKKAQAKKYHALPWYMKTKKR